MKLIFCLLFTILASKSNVVFSQNSYYVDPVKGDDGNTGISLGSAFKTIYKARDVIRVNNKNMARDIFVYLKSGIYQLDSTFTLSKSDGGTNGHNVIYRPYNCDTPVFSGGVKVINWMLHDAGKNIYKASINELFDSRQLYVNGVRAIRARSVDASGWSENDDGYDCPEEVSHWKNISQVEVVSHMVWKCHRGPIASSSNGHVTMAQPFWDNLHVQYGAPPVWVENAYELLDAEGEWYLDRSASILYYKPKLGEDMQKAEVVLAKQEVLLSCIDAHNIEMRGITFAYATWLLPNTAHGFPCHQADQMLSNQTWRDFEQMPGNIFLERCSDMKFVSCSFNHLGATALQLFRGCEKNLIYNNTFTDVSGSAIAVGSLNDSFPPAPDYVKNNTIENNLISNVAVEFNGSVAIILGYTEHTVVTHNEIRNLPYTGISVGWGWSNTKTVASGNEISYNLIDSVVTTMHDGGGIYTLSAQKGTQIHHNYIKNEINENAALHVDEGSSYIRFHQNVFENVYGWINLWSVTSLEDTVEYNYFDNDKNVFSGTDCITRNNTYVQNKAWPPDAMQIIKNAGRVYVDKCSPNTGSTMPALKIYPNPASTILFVLNEDRYQENYQVEIFDVQGRLLHTESKESFEVQFNIDIRNFASGVYFLRVLSGRHIFQGKFIKQ